MIFIFFKLKLSHFKLKFIFFNLSFRFFKLNFSFFKLNFSFFKLNFNFFFKLRAKRCSGASLAAYMLATEFTGGTTSDGAQSLINSACNGGGYSDRRTHQASQFCIPPPAARRTQPVPPPPPPHRSRGRHRTQSYLPPRWHLPC